MITLHDMNQSWTPPEGFTCEDVKPEGAYLVITYSRRLDGDQIVRGGVRVVKIYLQDMGREVARSIQDILDPIEPPHIPKPKSVARRFKFWNGFLLALQGIQEMFT